MEPPKKGDYAPNYYDIATIIVDGEKGLSIKRVFVQEDDVPFTLDQLASMAGCGKDDECTVILDRLLDGEMWKRGDQRGEEYERTHWFHYGDTEGYA